MSITGNLARGTGCSGTTSVDFGLYSRMVGGGNSVCRPVPGRLPSAPWLCGPCGAWATPPATATATSAARRRSLLSIPELYLWTADRGQGQGPRGQGQGPGGQLGSR